MTPSISKAVVLLGNMQTKGRGNDNELVRRVGSYLLVAKDVTNMQN